MENELNAKNTHGGARKGSGRKKTTAASIALRIPEDVAEILAKVDNRSAFIVEAVRHYAREKGI